MISGIFDGYIGDEDIEIDNDKVDVDGVTKLARTIGKDKLDEIVEVYREASSARIWHLFSTV